MLRWPPKLSTQVNATTQKTEHKIKRKIKIRKNKHVIMWSCHVASCGIRRSHVTSVLWMWRRRSAQSQLVLDQHVVNLCCPMMMLKYKISWGEDKALGRAGFESGSLVTCHLALKSVRQSVSHLVLKSLRPAQWHNVRTANARGAFVAGVATWRDLAALFWETQESKGADWRQAQHVGILAERLWLDWLAGVR